MSEFLHNYTSLPWMDYICVAVFAVVVFLAVTLAIVLVLFRWHAMTKGKSVSQVMSNIAIGSVLGFLFLTFMRGAIKLVELLGKQ